MNEKKDAYEALDDAAFDRLDELLSLMLDECLSDSEALELNALLLADPEARKRSIEAAQLHADLYTYFNKPKQSAIAPALPLPLPGGSGISIGQ